MRWLKNKTTTTQAGKYWEQVALAYLNKQGLSLQTQNYQCRFGEIDLVMLDQDTLVFVEVKYRQNKSFGGAMAAVSYAKQQKIKKTSSFYLQQQQLNEYNTPFRFDVVAIELDSTKTTQPAINWLINAFN